MKRLLVILVCCLAMVGLMVTPAAAAPAETGSLVCTKVIKCPEGYGHLVLHANIHAVDKDGCGIEKFDVHLQGQMLLKPECGKTEVCKLNLKLIVNGQTGNGGVVNGQAKFKCGDCDFHLVINMHEGHINCHITPVIPAT